MKRGSHTRISSCGGISHHTEYKMPLAFCLFEVRLSEIRDQVRGPEARMRSVLSSEFRPEMALDRAPRGLTRRCRRRFHFFVAPRSALGAFVFSAHGAPACSLLSGRVLSEMKRSSKPGKHCKTCTTSTPGKRRGTPPAKGGATYPEVSAAAAASRAAGHSKARSSTSASASQVHQQQQELQQSPQTAQKA